MTHMKKEIICIRGAGDIATGVIQKFVRSGFRVFALELEKPTAIRRQVSLSTAMEMGHMQVEDMIAKRVSVSREKIYKCWHEGAIPILADPQGESIPKMKPVAVIDAILAKRNTGTNRNMAPVTIGLGPGFCAPTEVDAVIETMRGHSLGRVITEGSALPNTGTPGVLGGQGKLRVLRAPIAGRVTHFAQIGDHLTAGQPVFGVDGEIVRAPFDGVLRGLITENMEVPAGMKTADIDPRQISRDEVYGISDKARCIGGAVLESYLYLTGKLLERA